jgi:ABC-type sugar transport system ATPase subunit
VEYLCQLSQIPQTLLADLAYESVLESILAERLPRGAALNTVSLKLDAGEIVALAGENGAGKSTLIKVLAAILAPDEGTITSLGSNANCAMLAMQ